MSREIKFRAWDRKSNQFVANPNGTVAGMSLGEIAHLRGLHPLTDDVQQYTGLKDKNGVEIYEGDIVSGVGHAVVAFGDLRWELNRSLCANNSGFNTISLWASAELEVIGNTFENPELLAEGQ